MSNYIFIFATDLENNNLKHKIMSKYYTKLPDGSFREDNLLWHEISNGSWDTIDTLILIGSLGLIAFAVIYGLFFTEVNHWPI